MQETNKKKLRKTQTSEILKYLRFHRSSGITQAKAYEMFGATRLSGLIFGLRKEGYDITSETKVVKNRYGGTSVIAVYKLVGEKDGTN